MTPSRVSTRVLADRAATIAELIRDLRSLPLGDRAEFLADRRNVWAAESYLRRCLEALFDIGRHILAKGFGTPATEYEQVAQLLRASGVLDAADAELLERMAGYRNRMVHFYHQVDENELYELSTRGVADIETVLERLLSWVRGNPDRIDHSL